MKQTHTEKWFWLSFCDDTLPTGAQFLGAVIVQGDDGVSAVQKAHHQGINPGGQVLIYELGLGYPQSCWANKLLTKDQATKLSQTSDWWFANGRRNT